MKNAITPTYCVILITLLISGESLLGIAQGNIPFSSTHLRQVQAKLFQTFLGIKTMENSWVRNGEKAILVEV